MKILVVGGAGYIGSQLVPDLLIHNYEVTVLDLLWFGNQLPESVKVLEKDIFDVDETLLEGFDQVVFLAGLSNDPMAEFSPAINFISNGAAPVYLAYMSKRAGVKRYIFADTCSVYGYTIDQLYDENSPTTCSYPYGVSKLQGEFGVLQLADDDFSVICLRQGTVSGVSPRMRFDLIVNTMYMTALTNNKITVNNPSIWRPILSIEDAVAAFNRAIQANQSISGVFNIASSNYTVGNVADIVWESVKKKFDIKVNLEIKNIQDFRNYKISTQKAQDILGARFHGSVKNIVENLSQEFGPGYDFDKDNFYNIRVFKKVLKERANYENRKN